MSSTNSTSGIAAVVQLNCNADKDANFEQAKKLLQKAKSLGAQVRTKVTHFFKEFFYYVYC